MKAIFSPSAFSKSRGAIYRCLKKFAPDETKRGNVGTHFVSQAITWLNQQRCADHAAIAFLEDEPFERKFTMGLALTMWVKLGKRVDTSRRPPSPPSSGPTVD